MSHSVLIRTIIPIMTVFVAVTVLCLTPIRAMAENEIRWPVQQTGMETAPAAAPVVKSPPPADPAPAARLTLEGCLEAVKAKKGEVDDAMPEVRNCYKQWANTLGSAVGTYSVIRSKPGPGPCYNRQVVTVSDKGPLMMETIPNPDLPKCASIVTPGVQKYTFSLVNVEYFRSLLEMPILQGFQEQFQDPGREPLTATKWTFIINNRPVKTITINVASEGVIPGELRTYLNSINAMILQSMHQ